MAKIVKTFTRQELKNMDMPFEAPEGGDILERNLIDSSRWSLCYELIFTLPEQEPGTAWRTSYSIGATETQNERPWEYDDTVDAVLVQQVEKVVKVWEEVVEND